MKKTPTQQLNEVRETLKEFWVLLNNEENRAIYVSAHIHGVTLSPEYMKKVTPLNRKLKKFMGIK